MNLLTTAVVIFVSWSGLITDQLTAAAVILIITLPRKKHHYKVFEKRMESEVAFQKV